MSGQDYTALARMLAAHATPEELKEIDDLVAAAPPNFLDGTFPEQAAFIMDEAALQLAFCTRRSAKSTSCGIKAIKTAWDHPGCKVLICGLTRDETKNVFWTDILEMMLVKHGLLNKDRPERLVKRNLTDLTITFPNGSMIRLFGMDANEDERRKALGQKYKLVIIDESQSFKSDLLKLVYEVIQPAVTDVQGSIVLAGTPGDFISGLFYFITQGHQAAVVARWEFIHIEQGAKWSCHSWSALQNTSIEKVSGVRVSESVAKMMAEKRATNPEIDKVAAFMQEWLGLWVVTEDAKIYSYRPALNDSATLPDFTRGVWSWLLGIDLGWEDPTAFVIAAYCSISPILWYLHAQAKSHMVLDAVEAEIKRLSDGIKLFTGGTGFDKLIIDGSAKQAVETMSLRFNSAGLNLHLTPAEKPEKMEHIKLMNGDLAGARIKIFNSPIPTLLGNSGILADTSQLREEMTKLVKDPNSDKLKEHPALPNHCCFVAGTMVQTETGPRTIESIRPGERVWTRQGLRKVLISQQTGVREIWSAVGLLGTNDHPVWTTRGLVPLHSLLDTDTLFSWAEDQQVESSELSAGIRMLRVSQRTDWLPSLPTARLIAKPMGIGKKVYNLTVAEVPEYFANGILVSNCDAGFYIHRHAWAFLSKVPVPGPKYKTPEWFAAEAAKMQQQAQQQSGRITETSFNNMIGIPGASVGQTWHTPRRSE